MNIFSNTLPFKKQTIAEAFKVNNVIPFWVKNPSEPKFHPNPQDTLLFNQWRMKTASYEINNPQGENVPFTTGEFEMLKLFLNSPGRILKRDYLMDTLHGTQYNNFDRAIDIQIGRIRHKLNDNARAPTFIKTIRGVGYIYIGTVYHLNG